MWNPHNDIVFSPQNGAGAGDSQEGAGVSPGLRKGVGALAGNSIGPETPKHFPVPAQDTSPLAVYEIVIIDRCTWGYASSYANM